MRIDGLAPGPTIRSVEATSNEGDLIYVGLDEAGYGPMLGPLCVGMAAIRLRGWKPGDDGENTRTPDVWSMLAPAVAREPKAAKRGSIVVNDSKLLKGSSSSKPLLHLERGVLAALGLLGHAPRCDAGLLDALGSSFPDDPWYAGEPVASPIDADAGEIALSVNAMRAACERAGVEVLGFRVRLVGEREFNDGCELWGSKGAVNLAAAGELVREAWDRWGALGVGVEGGMRMIMDRHGGRVKYGSFFQSVTGGKVATLEECAAFSRYSITPLSPGLARTMTALLTPEADARHFPVALASMAAKLVRETAMARINRHFGARMSGLKPTAGYVQDARRWLAEAGGVITPAERKAMVRRW